MNLPIVPKDFLVPERYETDRFLLRMLTIHDVDKDYDAVMSSIMHLQHTQPFGPGHLWPTEALTRDQDLIDLGWHQKEFQRRSSFAYTVLSVDESTCLGCLYIYPSMHSSHDAQIMMWVRQSEKDSGLDVALYEAVRKWIFDVWPFTKPGYPGRDIPWNEWEKLP